MKYIKLFEQYLNESAAENEISLTLTFGTQVEDLPIK
jgi:hypothetical protein